LKLLRDVLALLVGNAAPSLIALATLPALARVFPPNAVGTWAVFQSLLFIPAVVSTLRYDLAVIVEKHDKDADSVVAMVAALCALFGFGAMAIVLALELFGVFPVAGFTLMAGFCLAASFTGIGLFNLGIAVATRTGAFGLVLRARSSYAITLAAIPLALSAWWPSSDALILGTTLGFFAAAALFYPDIHACLVRFRGRGQGWRDIVDASRTNRSFAHFTVPYTLVTQTLGLAVTAVIATAHGAFVVGQFSLMYRTLHAPASIAINSLGQYAARPLVALADKRSLALEPMSALVLVLLAASIPAGAVGTLYGERLFIFVFGNSWSMAGRFAELAALPMCLYLSISWIDRLFDAWREQRFGFIVGSAGCIAWLASLLAGQLLSDTPMGSIVGWCVGLTANALIWGWALVKLAGWPGRTMLVMLAVMVAGAGPVFTASVVARPAGSTWHVAAVASAVAVAYGLLYLIVRRHRPNLSLLLRR
jgi:O-antigen/teichoic acid export membrane protein